MSGRQRPRGRVLLNTPTRRSVALADRLSHQIRGNGGEALAFPLLSPRLDHPRTRLVSVDSQGLWLLVPSDKDKEVVIDRAYGEGQAIGSAGEGAC